MNKEEFRQHHDSNNRPEADLRIVRKRAEQLDAEIDADPARRKALDTADTCLGWGIVGA